jgi:hypothetical protein
VEVLPVLNRYAIHAQPSFMPSQEPSTTTVTTRNSQQHKGLGWMPEPRPTMTVTTTGTYPYLPSGLIGLTTSDTRG